MIKRLLLVIAYLIIALNFLSPFNAQADATYPYTNPTYIPTAISPASTLSATGTYVMTNSGLATATLRVTGTCTSLIAAVQVSNDNSNWTTVPVYPVGGGSPITSVTANGFWKVNVAGFSKVRANVTALSASCTFAFAGTPGNNTLASSDPCQDPTFLKLSAVVNAGASADTLLVDAVTGKQVYVCGFAASAVGTNPTLTFKQASKTTVDCDTGATALTGAMIPAAADGMINLGSGSMVMATSTAKQLCLTTGATTSIQGVLTYVQK